MKFFVLTLFCVISFNSWAVDKTSTVVQGLRSANDQNSKFLWEEITASAYSRYLSWKDVCADAPVELTFDEFQRKYLIYRFLSEADSFIDTENKKESIITAEFSRLSGVSRALYNQSLGNFNAKNKSQKNKKQWANFYVINQNYCIKDANRYALIKNVDSVSIY